MSASNGITRLTAKESQILFLQNIKRYTTRRIATSMKMSVMEVEATLDWVFFVVSNQQKQCAYSADCFSCPLCDCAVEDEDAPQTNFICRK